MAARALTAKAAVMGVVAGVTTDAIRALPVGGLCRLVAAAAAGALMRAGQREVGAGMVEIPDREVARVVAARAVLAIGTAVLVVCAMTADAASIRVCKQLGAMAVGALGRAMGADQHELTTVVRIATGLPGILSVAVAAHLTQLAFMRIVAAMTILALLSGLPLVHGSRMACGALDFAVRAAQRELGRLIMVEQAVLPVGGVMTVAAGLAVAALVAVICAMAIDAGLAGVAKMRWVRMATGARCLGMTTDQRKLGLAMVEARRAGPAQAVVAGRTIDAQGATMGIVLAVASSAILWRRAVVALGLVTVLAIHLTVGVQQRKARLAVIEARGGPAVFRMAIVTALPHRALMRVVIAVTAQAIALQAMAYGAIDVTILAGALLVLAAQREIRLAVVEVLAQLGPRIGVVTIAAQRAQPALMQIVFAVAGLTCAGGIPMLLSALVTSAAFGPLVFAGEREIGQRVVKVLRVEANDVAVQSQMLGMALRTLARLIAAVEAGARCLIRGHVLVAIQTQSRLVLALE